MARVGIVIGTLFVALVTTDLTAGILPATSVQQESAEAKEHNNLGEFIWSTPLGTLSLLNQKGQERSRVQQKSTNLRLPSIRKIYNTIIPRDYNRKTVATYKSLGTNLFKVNKLGKSTYMLFAAPPLARDAMSRYIAPGKEQFKARGTNFIFGFKMMFRLIKS